MASTDEDKRRTQEASDGKFSSRGSGGEDENNNKWDVKGGGVLTFVDELFDLWYIAPPSRN